MELIITQTIYFKENKVKILIVKRETMKNMTIIIF